MPRRWLSAARDMAGSRIACDDLNRLEVRRPYPRLRKARTHGRSRCCTPRCAVGGAGVHPRSSGSRRDRQVDARRSRSAESEQPSSAAGEQAEGAFLLEVEGAARGGGDAAEPAAQVRDRGADRRLGQHPQAERQRGGADVVAALELERRRDRLQVRLTELPVRRPAAPRAPPCSRPSPAMPPPRQPRRARPAAAAPAGPGPATGRGPGAAARDPRGSGACERTCRAAGRPPRCA